MSGHSEPTSNEPPQPDSTDVNPYAAPIPNDPINAGHRPAPDGPTDASDIDYPGGNWGMIGLAIGSRLFGIGLLIAGANSGLPAVLGFFSGVAFLCPAAATMTLPGALRWKFMRAAIAVLLSTAAALLYIPLCFATAAMAGDGLYEVFFVVGVPGILAVELISTVGVLWLVRRMARLRISNYRRGEADAARVP